MRRLSLAGALVVLGALALAASASACSCAPMKPREALQRSDAAIVGRLIEVVPRGRLHADYRFEVERIYRGPTMVEAGEMLSVRSARRSAACALPRRPGHRYGLFLARASGHWFSGICGVIEPRRLRRAAEDAQEASRRGTGGGPQGDCAV